MCEEMIKVAAEGGHLAEICITLGIHSTSTFYRWCDDYPEFAEAYQISKLHSQAFHEKLLRDIAVGNIKNANFAALAMTLNNKFPDEYKRGTGSGSTTEINIGSINSIENMSTDDLEYRIKVLNDKMRIIEHDQGTDDSSEEGTS